MDQESKSLQDLQLSEIYEKTAMKPETNLRIQDSVQSFVRVLQRVQFRKLDPPLKSIYYQAFGSFQNGFGTENSDVDFTILTNSYVDEAWMLQFILREIERIKSVTKSERFRIDRAVFNAKIPVLKIMDTELRVEYDLCCNNVLGMLNTKLLFQYANLHEKVKKGGVLLKKWGKAKGIISQNDFSSYAIILMWISFLQRHYKLPNLQDTSAFTHEQINNSKLKVRRKKGDDYEKFQTNPLFLQDPDKIKEKMDSCTINEEPLHRLLSRFWTYYMQQGEHATQKRTIAIHKSPEELDVAASRGKERDHTFQIEDPFDLPHDPGSRVKGIERNTDPNRSKWSRFEEAAILMSKGQVEILFRKDDF